GPRAGPWPALARGPGGRGAGDADGGTDGRPGVHRQGAFAGATVRRRRGHGVLAHRRPAGRRRRGRRGTVVTAGRPAAGPPAGPPAEELIAAGFELESAGAPLPPRGGDPARLAPPPDLASGAGGPPRPGPV